MIGLFFIILLITALVYFVCTKLFLNQSKKKLFFSSLGFGFILLLCSFLIIKKAAETLPEGAYYLENDSNKN